MLMKSSKMPITSALQQMAVTPFASFCVCVCVCLGAGETWQEVLKPVVGGRGSIWCVDQEA